MNPTLDAVDRGIVRALQRDARNTTTQEMAEQVDVSPSTVRNRLDRLEDAGVIEGYYPKINYQATPVPLRVMFVCTADPDGGITEQPDVVDVDGVVDVRETMTDRRNVFLDVVAEDGTDVDRLIDAVHDAGLQVDRSAIVRHHHVRPANHSAFRSDDGEP